MIKVATIGTNYISDWFVEGTKCVDGIEVLGAYSRSEENAVHFAEKHGLKKTYTDLRALADDGEIDAVYIASPNYCHKDHAVMMLSASKHVFLEKPAVTSTADMAEIKNAAKRSGRVFMEGMRPVHGPCFEKIRSLIPLIGKVRYVSFFGGKYSARYSSFRNGEVLNAFNPALQNSALMDMGVYAAEFLIALFGYPGEVISSGIKLSNGFEGLGSIICSYDGMVANVTYSKITDTYSHNEIQGEDGCITIDSIHDPHMVKLYKRGCDAPECFEFTADEHTMTHEISDFRDIINGKADAEVYLKWTENTVRLCETVCLQNGVEFK